MLTFTLTSLILQLDDVARDYAGSRREELIPLELKDQHAEEGK